MTETSVDAGCGCGGIVVMILTALVLWALIFGVSYNGRYYSLSCTFDGVQVENVAAGEADQ